MTVPTPGPRVLVVEDNRSTRELLADYLEAWGFGVETAVDGSEALRKVRHLDFDLVLLDLMIPRVDGRTVCGIIRREMDLPVVMVTARTSEEDRVAGLDGGADDYIAKPFGLREVVARINAVLRRRGGNLGPERLEVGELVLDRSSRTVSLGGSAVDLTCREFELLVCLMSSPGRVFSRDVWWCARWDTITKGSCGPWTPTWQTYVASSATAASRSP